MQSACKVLALALALAPTSLAAQQAPRQLSEEDLAKLRRNVEASKAKSIEAQRQAELEWQREELRRREEALAYDDWEDNEPQPSGGGGFANVLNAFGSTLSSEMAKKQQEDVQRQRFLDNVRRQAEAVDRQRQRELEQQRLTTERARLEQQAQQQRQRAFGQQQGISAASGVGAGTGLPGSGISASSTMTAQQQAAQTREETLRTNAAAERKRLAEEREREAASERERVMRPFVEASNRQQALSATPAGTAAVSSRPKTVATPLDYGPAKAWCQASASKTYQCMGPLQNLLSWYPSLDVALSQAGCVAGEGYPPTPGHGGSSFNCGRSLKVNDYRMPTYDPYRGGGKPVLVKAGE